MNTIINPTMTLNNATSQKNTIKKATNVEFSKVLKNTASATSPIIDRIKKEFPNAKVHITSMSNKDIDNYMKTPIPTDTFIQNLYIAPNILKKMESDPAYADEMIPKIKDGLTPKTTKNNVELEATIVIKEDGKCEYITAGYIKMEENNSKKDDPKNKITAFKRLYNHLNESTATPISQVEFPVPNNSLLDFDYTTASLLALTEISSKNRK
ncbi:hypothetical protein G9F71_025920 [Clostridium sp. FP2]|uniref:hypothetical protein n=1 Tax=Clostridium sp. FP2 TaxID=2724481 RepID=UPI0013E90ACA|nr:hypothetical protein [Clostridium sp. FP2]MBZ9626246.1 hypothetical protein [Clostridium sp. FP2]